MGIQEVSVATSGVGNQQTGRVFAVRFSDPRPGAWLRSQPKTHWKLTGAGEIAFQADNLELTGRKSRPFWTGAKAGFSFPIQNVTNVVQVDRLVTCHVLLGGPGSAETALQFWAEDTRAAQEIVALLPRERTPEFERLQAEHDTYEQALETVGSRPVVTPLLVAVNVLVFAWTVYAGADLFKPDGALMVKWGTNFGPVTLAGEWWRLFTSMFLHFGLFHILLNMWALWSLGRLTERLFGTVHFLLLYVFAGLAGSIASLLWHPTVNSAGASGAIFGVLGGLLAFMLNPHTRMPASIAAKQRNSALAFVVYNIGFAHAGIDVADHIGGLLGGIAMGWVLARPLDVQDRQDPLPRLMAALGAGAVALVALSWPLAHPTPTVAAERRFRREFQQFTSDETRIIGVEDGLTKLEKAGKITEQEWGRRVAQEVVPQWQASEERLESAQLPRESRLAPLRDAIIDYVDARRRLDDLLSAGARDHDAEKVLLGKALAEKVKERTSIATQLIGTLY
jgi:rhomboid protease GluP